MELEAKTIRDVLVQESAVWLRIGANPGAWLRQEFVVRKGKEYLGRPLPAKYPKMAAKYCFHNAAHLVRRRRNLRYCEGFITNDGVPITIHHAWALDADDGVIDPTVEAPETWEYMGVAFTADEYRAARKGRKTPALLADEYDLVDVRFILQYCPELRDLMSRDAVAALNLVEIDHPLRDVVVNLDGLLTGNPAEATRNANQRAYMFSDPATFIAEVSQDAYYLADGGYSRLMVNDEGEVRGLSQVSRQVVKDRWHDADVQALVRELAALLSMPDEPPPSA